MPNNESRDIVTDNNKVELRFAAQPGQPFNYGYKLNSYGESISHQDWFFYSLSAEEDLVNNTKRVITTVAAKGLSVIIECRGINYKLDFTGEYDNSYSTSPMGGIPIYEIHSDELYLEIRMATAMEINVYS